MSRWQLPVAILAVAGVLIAGVAVLAPGGPPSTAQRADALARELRCPDCQALSVADSPTAAAAEIRRRIDELLAAGATDDEVRAPFVERYGEWILLAPSAPVAWLLPSAVVLAGVAGLAIWLVARRQAPAAAPRAVAADERRRVHEEAEALDA
jgi:cytochrome c-type biogenesis protein CcmH